MPVRESDSSRHGVEALADKAEEERAQATCGVIPSIPSAEMKSALLVSPLSEDHQLLSQIFAAQGWTLQGTRTLGSALAVLRDQQIPVVITERDLPLGDWKDLFQALQLLPHRPLIVVTSRLADEYLWAEVLSLGGHDVVAKPFQATEVQWVLETAWRIWASRNKTTVEYFGGRDQL